MQGSVVEHLEAVKRLKNVEAVEVKTLAALSIVDGLILPGGESTTISKLLKLFGLFAPLKARIEAGMPVWGTCAGMILLAKELVGEPAHLGLMDITVKRNAYGSQLDSFETSVPVAAVSPAPIQLIFIRAPWIERVGKQVEVLLELNGHIVAARQKNMLVTSFHPELGKGLEFHRYFAGMIET